MFDAYHNVLPNDLQQLFAKSIPLYSARRTHQFMREDVRINMRVHTYTRREIVWCDLLFTWFWVFVLQCCVFWNTMIDWKQRSIWTANMGVRRKKCRGAMLSWIRGLASEPCSRVLHGQFSKNTASLTMHGLDLTMPRRCARVRVHWGVLSPHHLCPVHGFLDPVSGMSVWWKQHAIFSNFRTTSERNAANRKRWIQAHRFICQGNVWHWQPCRRSSSVVWRTEA